MSEKSAFPVQSSELSIHWLNQTLAQAFGQEVTDFSVAIIGEGVGVLGELARVLLTLKDGTQETVVCKFSAVMDDSREFARVMGYYQCEHDFYQHLASRTPLRTPHIYFQTIDPQTYRFVIVMEDVEGKVGDQLDGCSKDDALLIVSEIAGHHAQWNAPEKLDEFPFVRQISNENFLSTTLSQMDANIPLYLERYPDKVPDWLPGRVDGMRALITKCAGFFDRQAATLIHGDYRLDNFVFHEGDKGRTLTVLDWQLVFRSMGSYDLGYFMFQSLDVEMRRACERELIEAYVEARNAGNGQPISVDSVYQELPVICFFCTLYPLIAGGIIDLSKPRSRPLIEAMSDRAYLAMEDHNSLAVVQAL